MPRRWILTWFCWPLCLAAALLSPAWALIDEAMKLGDMLADPALLVLATRCEKIDRSAPGAVFTVEKTLKGKTDWTRLPVNLTGKNEAEHQKLLRRLAPGQLVLFFAKKEKEGYTIQGYTNGTWFSVQGLPDGDVTRFAYTNCEPVLRRTYKGTSEELLKTVADVVARKRPPPAVDLKEPPGLGPELPLPQENKP